MATKKAFTTEIAALSKVLEALAGLDEADQAWVLQTAASRLAVPDVVIGGGAQAGVIPPVQPPPHGATIDDLKRFMRAKSPQTDVQRVACLAYFLTKSRKQPHFKSTELTALNTEAAEARMNMSRAVNNATNQNRYLAPAGGGKKQITKVGEDVVDALPDQEKAKLAEQKTKLRRKKAGRKRGRRKARP